MRGGLILDMENKNALITNAMLTVYIDEKIWITRKCLCHLLKQQYMI